MPPTRWKSLSFLGCLTAMAIVWGWVLPHLATLDAVRSRIDSNRRAGINPTAVFYTDHPTMPEIENRIEARRLHPRRQPSSPRPVLGND
jgi:hypothetical protein